MVVYNHWQRVRTNFGKLPPLFMAILYNKIRFERKERETTRLDLLWADVLGPDECERLIAQAHEYISKKKAA